MNISKEKERRALRRMEQQRQNRCLEALLAEIDAEEASQKPRKHP